MTAAQTNPTSDQALFDYAPYKMIITAVIDETPDTKTFKLKFADENVAQNFRFHPGQFGLYSVFGCGEATFCIASPTSLQGQIECSVKRVGRVTQQMHRLNAGDVLGFRGPYGNWFPIDKMKDKNLLFIGGGIGLAPLRPLIFHSLEHRDDFNNITILYGARSVADLVYKYNLKEWQARKDISTVYTVDPGGETKDWDGKIGFVPTIMNEMQPSPKNTVVITCGPPIMIKFVLQGLKEMKFSFEDVYTTLENRMKCGIGKCGRCNVGKLYVCKDGPVFNYRQIEQMPPEF